MKQLSLLAPGLLCVLELVRRFGFLHFVAELAAFEEDEKAEDENGKKGSGKECIPPGKSLEMDEKQEDDP